MIQISSDAAFGAVTAGMFLIYGELCAPGLVVPGSLGAIGVLGGGWLLWERHPSLFALACLGAGLMFLAAAVRLRSYRIWAGLSLSSLCAGCSLLLSGSDSISPALSLPLPALWGGVTILLGRLAFKARASKRTLRINRYENITSSIS
jgi:membrane-bound ClpP family serine protease